MRIRFAARLAIRHLLISGALAALAALLVFFLWYPPPTNQLLDVGHVYLLLLGVDVVCGPLLTLLLASPKKSRRELVLDLGIVGFIQIGALVYGLFALESARPLAYVFEQDRLVVVTRNELYTVGCGEKCDTAIGPFNGMGWYISRPELDGNGRLRSLDLSLQGVSPAQRPVTWEGWDWQDSKLQSALGKLTSLKQEEQKKLILLRGEGYLTSSGYRYLPVVSSKTLGWIVVFDGQGTAVDFFKVDGFR